MNVCSTCFNDEELIGFIESEGYLGNCDVSSNKNLKVISIDELVDFFDEFLGCFEVTEEGHPLIERIQEDWDLFSSDEIAKGFLEVIIQKTSHKFLSTSNQVDYNQEIRESYQYWEVFKNELKWKRRFIQDIEKLSELGWDSFFNIQYKLTSDVNLYRARIHHEGGKKKFTKKEMGCPPREVSTGGRANPSGIPYLYLSDNEKTVLYEVRASYLDELSIGVFTVQEVSSPVLLADFTREVSIFKPSAVANTIKSRFLIELISKDLSKPMRRYDSDIEYIPTQFICEFINIYTDAKGIIFQSSLDPEGKNFVIFDESIITCKNVKLARVTDVSLKSGIINQEK